MGPKTGGRGASELGALDDGVHPIFREVVVKGVVSLRGGSARFFDDGVHAIFRGACCLGG